MTNRDPHDECDTDVHVALLSPPAADLSLTGQTLRRERLVVALPAEQPLAVKTRVRAADLAGLDLITHSANRHLVMHHALLGVLRASGVKPHIRHQVGETSTHHPRRRRPRSRGSARAGDRARDRRCPLPALDQPDGRDRTGGRPPRRTSLGSRHRGDSRALLNGR